MSDLVSSVLSRHGQPDSLGYRIILADGSMHVKKEVEVRCMVRGDIAIESYDPHLPIENERDEPVCINAGPRQGDVLLVRIDGCRAACKVLEVGQKRGRPLYTVEYDDGMLVQDHLVELPQHRSRSARRTRCGGGGLPFKLRRSADERES